jgi:hypothetical protein
VYRPDGRPFLTFEQLDEERLLADRRAEQALEARQLEAKRADEAEKRAADALAEVERLRKLLAKNEKPTDPA